MRVALAVPVVGGVKGEVYYSHLNLACDIGRKADLVLQPCVDLFPHARAREELMKSAIRHECDFLMFVDSDMLVPPDAFSHLREVLLSEPNIAMTVGHAYRRGYPYTSTWTVRVKTPEGDGLYQAEAGKDALPFDVMSCGLACNLVSLKWIRDNLLAPYFHQDLNIWEDAYFCGKIQQAGGRIVAVPSVRAGHLTEGIIIDDSTAEYLRKRDIEIGLPEVKPPQHSGNERMS